MEKHRELWADGMADGVTHAGGYSAIASIDIHHRVGRHNCTLNIIRIGIELVTVKIKVGTLL